jgi:integrase/recombinase XerD
VDNQVGSDSPEPHRRGIVTGVRVGRESLWDLMHLWLDASEAKGCSPRTIDHYRRQLSAFLDWLAKDKPSCTPQDVSSADIRGWLKYRRSCGISTHTVHSSFRSPRIFWNWLIKEEFTENNPFSKVEPPKRDKVLKPDLTVEEVKRLFAVCEGKEWRMLRDKALLGLLLDTGLRISEACNLKISDVLDDAMIIRGKGGAYRYVFLSPEVRLSIRRYLRACPCVLALARFIHNY